MWLLTFILAAAPDPTNPLNWATYIGTIAPVASLAIMVWWREVKRNDHLTEQLEQLNAKMMEMQNQMLPVLTKAVGALEDAIISKRGGA